MPLPRRAITTKFTRRGALGLGAAGAAAALAACGQPRADAQPSRTGGATGAASPSVSKSASASASASEDATASTAALSRNQQVGQRVIYSYPGTTPPQSLLTAISDGLVGGVIFFDENATSASQLKIAVKKLVAAHADGPVKAPLLLMTDQEGGQVRRVPGAPELSEKQVGDSSDAPGAATDAGSGAGENLASLGLNLNLAPVLDVYRTDGDFADEYQRSYSMDPSVVSTLGSRFIKAQQKKSVAATAKHFPGLGSATTDQNTDLGPVTLNAAASELRNTDERPYREAISAGVDLVMLSWAIYPAFDSRRPAGLSSTIIGRELRTRLDFKGVTITDALEAKSLAKYGSYAQRGVLAAGAGMDLLLCSARDVSQGRDTVTAMVDALSNGDLSQDDFDSSLARVMKLRSKLD